MTTPQTMHDCSRPAPWPRPPSSIPTSSGATGSCVTWGPASSTCCRLVSLAALLSPALSLRAACRPDSMHADDSGLICCW